MDDRGVNDDHPRPRLSDRRLYFGAGRDPRRIYVGRGSVLTRAKVEVEETRKEREALIVTEIPYQINKAT